MTSLNPPTTKQKHLLLIEDNPADVEMVLEWAQETNFPMTVGNVENGELALAELESEGAVLPDLILLDINLPRTSGLDILNTLKNNRRLCKIPVVMLTSSSAPDDVERSYRAHANAYVQKNADLKAFYKALNCIRCLFFETAILPNG